MKERLSTVESKIDALKLVSGHPKIALRLIELSKDPEVELEDYAELIESDPGMLSGLLSLVNSAWFGQ